MSEAAMLTIVGPEEHPLGSTSSKGKYCPAARAEHDAESSSATESLEDAEDFVIGTQVADGGAAECYQAFEGSMVVRGLSQLSRTASGSHSAYLRLDLNNTTLDSADAIEHCIYLQHVNISSNHLTTLRALGMLGQLAFLDASQNKLTQVLDFGLPDGTVAVNSSISRDCEGAATCNCNLRSADLSYNKICQIRNLEWFKRLSRLALDGNQIEHIGGGLRQLQCLQYLSLSGNRISSCKGLEGLTSLRELALDGNRLTSLAPLSGLTNLEVLHAAHNQLSNCEGVHGLTSLLRLDVSGNLLRRLEVLAAAAGLHLLAELDVAANPFEAAQNTRLYIVYLLPQVSLLNGAAVSSTEKADAANMAGAAADGLLAIRRQYFAAGELDDGGGAVPPTAAGLIASRAEEECACRDPDAMFDAIDAWAWAIPPSTALLAPAAAGATADDPSAPARTSAAGSVAAGAGLSQHPGAHVSSSSRPSAMAVSTAARNSSASCKCSAPSTAAVCTSSVAGTAVSRSSITASDSAAGAAAVASLLAAGCSKEDPWAQLQLARACYSWVVTHVQLPRGCSAEAGADAVTWDVGLHLFGEQEEQQLIHQALLPCHSGTWAESVSQLLVQLVRACHMEAVQLSGYWKAGGAASVQPGNRLAAHNHSWVAVKVNGRWRLLDPVYAIIRQGQLPFYLPPEAYIHTHLPFEAYWQLLPEPVSLDQWWQMPEVSLAFCAAGGQLLGSGVKACNELQAVRAGSPLPSLKLRVAAPSTDQQHVCVKLLDHTRQPVATWSHKNSACVGRPYSSSRPTIRQLSQQQQQHISKQLVTELPQQLLQQQQQQQQQQLYAHGQQQQCLVYQQPVLETEEMMSVVPIGHQQLQVAAQELWVSPPAPGTYYVHVELVSEVQHWMQLSVDGLPKTLDISYWQREEVIRVKAVVPAALPHNPADGMCVSPAILAAALPQPQQLFGICGGFQLISPKPCKPLEADRPELFEVVVPGAAAVAVGCEEIGWQELGPLSCNAAAAASGAGDIGISCAGSSGSSSINRNSMAVGLFTGTVILPRSDKCFVAVQLDSYRSINSSSSSMWVPIISLRVAPQVQHIVPAPAEPESLAEFDSSDPSLVRLRKMLSALDVDGDGVVSRRDMLLAFRQDRQLADHLKMPPRIKVGDGSFDKFLSKFITINTDGLGFVSFKQLAAYMTAINSSSTTSDTLAASGPGSPRGKAAGSGSRTGTADIAPADTRGVNGASSTDKTRYSATRGVSTASRTAAATEHAD